MKKIFTFLFVLISFANFMFSDSLTIKLQSIKTKYQIAGMSIAVTKNNSVVYNKGFGLKDVSRNLPVDDSTVYRIASISKMISATALMQLWEQGKFGLDEDISRYIGFKVTNPNFPSDSITFRKILSHTASLRDGTGYDGFLTATYNNNPPPSISSLLVPGASYYTSNMWSSSKRPNANYFAYSNINFGVVGTLVEKISGERFDIYCKNHIFTPLNIAGSFNIQDIPNINNVSVLYRKEGSTYTPQADNYSGTKPAPRNLSGYVIGTNGVIFAPQGGLRVSSFDLSKFMTIHSNGGIYENVRILQQATIDTIHKSMWSFNGSNGDNYYGIFNAYGFGNSRTFELLPGSTLIGHPGEAYGLISDLYFEQNGQFGIIFITNGGVWGLGTYSGWYNIEEEVYKAVKSELPNLTDVNYEGNNIFPENFKVYPNYPNPFNPSTTIDFYLSNDSFVNVSVYDILGNKIETLKNEILIQGTHSIKWNADNLSSKVYFCTFDVHENNSNKKYSEKIKLMFLK